MGLGTGIFLSAIFLGLVALFIATKDRWNWKKIALWPLGIIFAFSVIGGVSAYGYRLYNERLQVPTTFQGIQLGQTFDDAEFKLGKAQTRSEAIGKFLESIKDKAATSEYAEANAALIAAREEEARAASKKVRNGEYWFGSDRVTIKNNLVADIFYRCDSAIGDFTAVNQIGCGASGDEILAKFGSDVRILCAAKQRDGDGPSRVYDVIKYGTRYYLTTNSVEAILVATPSTLKSYVGLNWDRCKT